MGDDADACVTVKGDGTSTDGCPRVEREFTDVTYVNGQLVGQLRVADTESVPEDSCLGTANSNERRIYVALGSEGSQGTTGSYVQSDRSFAFSFGRPLTDGELYRLYRHDVHRSQGGLVRAAVTDELTLLVDSDDDGVRDNADKCDHVDGDGVDRWVSVGRAGVHRHHLRRRCAGRDAEGEDLRGGRVHRRERRVGDPAAPGSRSPARRPRAPARSRSWWTWPTGTTMS